MTRASCAPCAKGRARWSGPGTVNRHAIDKESISCPTPPTFRPSRGSQTESQGVIASIFTGPHIAWRDSWLKHADLMTIMVQISIGILRTEDIGSLDDRSPKHLDQALSHPVRQADLFSVSTQSAEKKTKRHISPHPNKPDSAAGYPATRGPGSPRSGPPCLDHGAPINLAQPQSFAPRSGLPSSFLCQGPMPQDPKNQTTNPKPRNQTLSAAGKSVALLRGRKKNRTI